ncbi:MAG: hypothetical protein IPG78_03490 [Ignavibacteria bacterium]|nr:hypothetical protein [Ignavibacteria bacterium]
MIKLGGILKDNNIQLEERNKLIEKLYNFFLGNPKLEAKLNLLHQCLTHEGVKVVKKELDKQSGKYKEIKDEVNKVKHHGKTVVEYLFEHSICFDGDDYIEPLSKLRDELLQD